MLETKYHSVNIRTQSGPLKTGLTVKRTLAVLLSTLVLPAAWADDPQQQQMQQQVDKLEQELRDMKVQMGDVQKKNAEISDQNKAEHQQLEMSDFQISNKVKAMQDQWDQIPTTNKNQSGFVTDGVTLTFGGYLAEENALRSRNLQADINSPFSKIPFNPNPGNILLTAPQSQAAASGYYNQSSFNATARQSRFAVKAQGYEDKNTLVTGYYEMDWLGDSPTANGTQSNSYTARVRHLYSNIDWIDSGWHLLAGQSWSLAVLNTQGITPRNEEIPVVIDAEYMPGFVWNRQAQIRVVKDWDKKYWAAFSLEQSQTSGVAGATPTGVMNNYTLPAQAGGLLTPGNYSVNKFPDIIGKLAMETELGHYEVFGMLRNFDGTYSNVNATAAGQNTWAGSMGFGSVLNVVPHRLDFKVSGLYGNGVGRYGTSTLNDATIGPSGELTPMRGGSFLTGLTLHVKPTLDVYADIGRDWTNGYTYGSGGQIYGYGNNVLANPGQFVANAAMAGYTPYDLNNVTQETIGFWWAGYKGYYGAVKFGVQYSHTSISAFAVRASQYGGAFTPSTFDNMILTSIRFYPM
jgi:TolA-binding protein